MLQRRRYSDLGLGPDMGWRRLRFVDFRSSPSSTRLGEGKAILTSQKVICKGLHDDLTQVIIKFKYTRLMSYSFDFTQFSSLKGTRNNPKKNSREDKGLHLLCVD